MMPVEWTKDLATGYSVIDDQHKELFKRINALLSATWEGKGHEEAAKTLDFLEEYVIFHFGTEENKMKEHSYPEYDEHRAKHVEMIHSLDDLKARFGKEGANVDMLVSVNSMVLDWFLNHIKKYDFELARFLKSKPR